VAAQHLNDEKGQNTPARAVIDEVLTQCQLLAAVQRDGVVKARLETKRHNLLARVIRGHHLHPLLRVMRWIPAARDTERLVSAEQGQFNGPPLVQEARRVAAIAAKYQKELVAAGLPSGFLDELVTTTDALQQSIELRAELAQQALIARAKIAKHLRRGRHALDVLESMLSQRALQAPGGIAAWKAARRRGDDAWEKSNREDSCAA
jgi:hypothetical protein